MVKGSFLGRAKLGTLVGVAGVVDRSPVTCAQSGASACHSSALLLLTLRPGAPPQAIIETFGESAFIDTAEVSTAYSGARGSGG